MLERVAESCASKDRTLVIACAATSLPEQRGESEFFRTFSPLLPV